jgi:sulfate adenylyltransferase subunit 1
MVTAASTANLAIILIDARKGVLTQTRRHSKLASAWSASRTWSSRSTRWTWSIIRRPTYEKIKADYLEFAAKVGIEDVRFIPLSALNGDMIVDRGDRLALVRRPDPARHP